MLLHPPSLPPTPFLCGAVCPRLVRRAFPQTALIRRHAPPRPEPLQALQEVRNSQAPRLRPQASPLGQIGAPALLPTMPLLVGSQLRPLRCALPCAGVPHGGRGVQGILQPGERVRPVLGGPDGCLKAPRYAAPCNLPACFLQMS